MEALKKKNKIFEEGENKNISEEVESPEKIEFCNDLENVKQKKIEKEKPDFFEKKEKYFEKKKIKSEPILQDDFKKNLYIESPEITELNENQITEIQKRLGNIKVRGKNQIRPIWTWHHCGLPKQILYLLIQKQKFKTPFPIQCQAIPSIMSGRDIIGVAETGSGKTLAYILPLLRHIKAQRKLKEGDGPIGLILVPTRELASQVFSTVQYFGQEIDINSAAVYGGTSLTNQFTELKRGVEIVVCTPGRMIDVLSTSKGRITNLSRVTYVVIDEGDRMFDLGFEPQIERIISRIRRNRQTVIFSATFPRNVEALARRILINPLEIVVGNRGQVCRNVNQKIYICEKEDKDFKLLELLGIWLEKGSVIVFVDKKEDADKLFTKLLEYKYQPLLLHGGQDDDDRVETFNKFKKKEKNVLIATSLVARGLDIKNVILVINYYCPTYKEDYIHRIGRTGRAGKKGFAYTFITEEEDKYAEDIIKALQISNAVVPKELENLHRKFQEKVQRGEARKYKNKNLSGRGFKFDPEEESKMKLVKKILSGMELDQEDLQEIDEMKKVEKTKKIEKENLKLLKDPRTREAMKRAAIKAASEAILSGATNEDVFIACQKAIRNFFFQFNSEKNYSKNFEDQKNLKIKNEVLTHDKTKDKITAEFIINDYPEKTRRKISNMNYLSMMAEMTKTIISIRGIYNKPGNKNLYNQKKLHIFIEGDNKMTVMGALYEIKRVCEESALKSF